MRIRPAETRDALAVAEGEWAAAATPGMLVGRPGEIPLSAFAAKIAELSRLGCYWVAEDGAAVVGHAFLDPMKLTGNSHVFHLTIVAYPGHTGRGVGTDLMRTLIAWSGDRNDVGKIELLVRATNARAIALYRKFGFVEEGCLRRRVRTADGEFLDDVSMAWFPPRAHASGTRS